MIARDFKKEDYEMYEMLLKKRGRAVMPLGFLPPTGVVIESNGLPIAFGFLTKTDTPIAAIGDFVTDQMAGGEARDNALFLLIKSLENKAKESGYSAVCASTNHNGLMQRYVKMNYMKADTGLSLFSRLLCHSVDY